MTLATLDSDTAEQGRMRAADSRPKARRGLGLLLLHMTLSAEPAPISPFDRLCAEVGPRLADLLVRRSAPYDPRRSDRALVR